MRDFDLRELQLCELEIMKEFIRICEKHHLQYYVAYGTLLGAIRHKGFIPWDDDIDVHMPWSDFLTFKKLCETELGQSFSYDDWYIHHDYYLLWGKLRKNQTTCMTRGESALQIHWGVGIDIFPLFPSDKPSLSLTKKMASVILEFCLKRAYVTYGGSGWKKALKRILYRLFPRHLDDTIITHCLHKLNHSSTHAEWFYLPEVIDPNSARFLLKNTFGEGKKEIFEDMEVTCPYDYDCYLKKIYGSNYMEIPEVEDRLDHGDIIVDLNQDYRRYQQELMQK